MAIVGQEKMKLSLILNVINPTLSGVLIRGEKGTAKSTAVRSLASILPEIQVIKDCPFQISPSDSMDVCEGCFNDKCRELRLRGENLEIISRPVNVVDLPIGATEDRVVGTLDLEHALKTGEKRVEPGILAQANKGILYVDEVNLLDDHIVDILLDAAAMGVNTIEREGISFSHPARFVLIGTMNPEEGELRPQLLDRFGLCVHVKGVRDPKDRIEIMRRRSEFEEGPEKFIKKWEKASLELKNKIQRAKEIYFSVGMKEDLLFKIVETCINLNIDGHRGDIIVYKTAKTLAAFNGRDVVKEEDVDLALQLAFHIGLEEGHLKRSGKLILLL